MEGSVIYGNSNTGGLIYNSVPQYKTRISSNGVEWYPECSNIFLPYYYITYSLKNTLKPEKIIFNDPATIVYWNDGTKTVVKCSKNEKFIEEVGLAMAFMKKLYPSRSEFLRLVENAYHQENKQAE